MSFLGMMLIAFILMGILVALTAFNNKSKYVTVGLLGIILISGLALYGVGYMQVAKEHALDSAAGIFPCENTNIMAALRAAIATLRMFVGVNAFGDVAEAPIFKEGIFFAYFWAIHFMALAVSSKALLSTFGAGALRYLRSITVKRGPLAIIYGVNEESVSFGRQIRDSEGYSIVYVDNAPELHLVEEIENRIEGIMLTDKNALAPNVKFLRNIGAFRKNRKIVVYALHEKETANITYARNFNSLLKKQDKIHKKNISLSIVANMELNYGGMLQADKDEEFGFGSVLPLDRYYLVARQLINLYPPCDYMQFDTEKCVAKTDFHGMIVGFGKIGQAVFKKLIMNGQFEGSHFKLTIVDPNYESQMGCMNYLDRALFEKYDVEFIKDNAGSIQFYQEMDEMKDINYIAICISDSNKNNEIANEIQAICHQKGNHAAIFECTRDSVVSNNLEEGKITTSSIFTQDNLDVTVADKQAMALNYIYCKSNTDGEDVTPLDYWVRAGYMDKMSSRASADFAKSFLKIMGREAIVVKGSDKLEVKEEQLENLAKTEHLRWCAYFYAMGYNTMTMDAFKERGRQYMAEMKKSGSSRIKIQRDSENKLHACLVDWDDLDLLSEVYTSFAGREKDYKQDDRNNVLMLPKLL